MDQVCLLFTENRVRLTDSRWTELLHRLPLPLHPPILRFYRWEDRQASLFGKLLLIEGLKECGFDPELIGRLQRDRYERPFLPAELDFNISHSGELVVCAIYPAGRIGIDIERVRPVELRYFHSVLTPEEQNWIGQCERPEERFFHIWTKKEATIKVSGKGLAYSEPLNRIIGLDRRIFMAQQWWHLREIEVHTDYICYISAEIQTFDLSLREHKFAGE